MSPTQPDNRPDYMVLIPDAQGPVELAQPGHRFEVRGAIEGGGHPHPQADFEQAGDGRDDLGEVVRSPGGVVDVGLVGIQGDLDAKGRPAKGLTAASGRSLNRVPLLSTTVGSIDATSARTVGRSGLRNGSPPVIPRLKPGAAAWRVSFTIVGPAHALRGTPGADSVRQ